NKTTPLIIAGQQGYHHIAQVLIDAGATVNHPGTNATTSLFWAAKNNRIETLRVLLDAKADVELANGVPTSDVIVTLTPPTSTCGHRYGKPLWKGTHKLLQCCLRPAPTPVLLMMQAIGTDVGLMKLQGERSPLWTASYEGHAAVVADLLAAGATVGATALYAAAEAGHEDIVRQLLASGADVNYLTSHLGSALYTASKHGHESVEGRSPLWTSAFEGHETVVRVLLDAGAFEDLTCNLGATPLFVAAQEGNQGVVQQLLNTDATVDMATHEKATPLIVASTRGLTDIVRMLLVAGADIHLADMDGCTPLMKAARNKHPDVVSLLLNAGANVHERRSSDGATPFFFACEAGDVSVARLLIDAGADIREPNDAGVTPREIAKANGRAALVAFLDAVASPETSELTHN
ncbi:hypothetical protein ACHHYP_06453, partial [Achlya hypogyna]